MVRPRKSANASRDNGAKAKNKGKAKATVPVLGFAYNEHAGITEVVTEQRARLPKGFVAYESELKVNEDCLKLKWQAERDTAKAMSIRDRMHENHAAQAESLKMATEVKDWDVAKKMSKLKKMIKGAPSTFAFKEPATAQPRDRPRRVRFSV